MPALRTFLASLCLALILPKVASAQLNVAATVGTLQYDKGGDDDYLILGVQIRYFVTTVFRVGFIGGTSHIGDPPLRDWTLDGTDERVWRGAGFIELGTTPLSKVSGTLRGFLGVNHSSGVIVEPTPPNSGGWYGITDTPTGVSYGGGLGVEVGPYYRFRFLAQANVWFDQTFGATATDPELIFGLGVDF